MVYNCYIRRSHIRNEVNEVRCTICGKETDKRDAVRCMCNECEEQHNKEHQDKIKEYITLKNYFMYERAIKRFEHSGLEGGKKARFTEPSIIVKEYIDNNPETLDSTEEVIFLIAMVEEEIKVKCQQKIGRYKVDFLLPEYKTIVEIDGFLHKHHKRADQNRDAFLREEMGKGWEVVRIPTDFVNNYPDSIADALFTIREVQIKSRELLGDNANIKVENVLEDLIRRKYSFEEIKRRNEIK